MDLVKLENNLITKPLTIKTTEVDILDTQWAKDIVGECYPNQKLTPRYSTHVDPKRHLLSSL